MKKIKKPTQTYDQEIVGKEGVHRISKILSNIDHTMDFPLLTHFQNLVIASAAREYAGMRQDSGLNTEIDLVKDELYKRLCRGRSIVRKISKEEALCKKCGQNVSKSDKLPS